MGTRQIFNNLRFKCDQNKPELMLAAGLIGVIGATVLACRATIKAKDIVEECNERIEELSEEKQIVYFDNEKTELPAVDKKEIRKVYLKTGLKLAKVYAPALAIETAAFTLLIKSNSVQRDRLAGLTAAYISIDQAFKKYREAVIKEFGEEKDLELRGIKREQIEVTNIDDDGNVTKETKTYDSLPYGTYISEYAKEFDRSCPDWTKSRDNNLNFLRLQEIAATDKLVLQGHLFLNEVYDMLGIPRTTAGQVVGWRYLKDNVNGDNYVKFDIHEIVDEDGDDVCLIDFNVDGPIYEYI